MGEVLLQDIRYGCRTLWKKPGFAAVAVLTLGLSIGANTTIFSVVNGVLLRPLPYDHSDRTLVLWNHYAGGLTHAAVSAPEYFDIKEQARALDSVAAVRPQRVTLLGEGADPEAIGSYQVTPNIFELLGASPALGRSFQEEDGKPAAEPVLILAHALWVRRFGSDPAIVGRQVNIGGRIRTVIGVMPADVRFPDAPLGFMRDRADIWVPSTLEQVRGDSRGNQNLGVLARIREGASAAEVAADIRAIEGRFKNAFPRRYAPPAVPAWSILAVPMSDQMVGSVKPALIVLAAAAGLVLFVACVNVANLLLARSAARQRELAVRLALGANRRRLIRQMLTESALLALAGGASGIVLARAGIAALVILGAGNIPRLDDTGIDGLVLAFSLTISILTGILIGVIPAFQLANSDLRSAMNDASRGTEGQGRKRLRSALVTVQVAMAVVVLIAAGLLGRSFAALMRIQPGFSSEGVMSMQLTLPQLKYDTQVKLAVFVEQLQQRVSSIPGASSAAAMYPLPMSGQGWSGTYTAEGAPAGPEVQLPHAEYAVAMPGYFQTMRIALLEGRDFTAADRIGAPKTVIVDEMLARRHWPNESAVNKRISTSGRPGDWITIVGVVGHVYSSGPHSEGEPQLYLPYLQSPQGPIFFAARTTGNPLALAGAMRQAVRELDRDLPVTRLAAVDDLVADAVARPRLNSFVLAVFAFAALLIASIGLYGVVSCLVAQRTREIGIRIALGGQPRHVRRMVVRESLIISVSGLLIGCVTSLALSQTVAGLLFGVQPIDPATYAAITLLLLAVSLVASYGPARRAAKVDPMVTLREH